MNKLEWRYVFAKQYAKRRGDFLMGWILSRTAVEKAKIKTPEYPKVVFDDQGGAIFVA